MDTTKPSNINISKDVSVIDRSLYNNRVILTLIQGVRIRGPRIMSSLIFIAAAKVDHIHRRGIKGSVTTVL